MRLRFHITDCYFCHDNKEPIKCVRIYTGTDTQLYLWFQSSQKPNIWDTSYSGHCEQKKNWTILNHGSVLFSQKTLKHLLFNAFYNSSLKISHYCRWHHNLNKHLHLCSYLQYFSCQRQQTTP